MGRQPKTAEQPSRPIEPAVKPALTGTQLATAFEGKLERRRLSVGYHIGLALVAAMMVVLPIIYFGMIAGTCWLTWWYATRAVGMFEMVRGRALMFIGAAYIAPIVAGGLLVLAMLAPLFRWSRKGPKTFWVSRSEEPLLYAYVENLCDAMRAPRPQRISITATANASAHIDNGVFGVLRRRLVLTIGLPLPATMSLRQFTAVLAHELGHFSQGSSMRLSYVVHRINRWFGRLGFGRTSVDELIDGMLAGTDIHFGVALIGMVSKLVVGIAKQVLKGFAILSHGLAMNQSRQAEFDADYQAARIVGSKAMGEALQTLPATGLAFETAVKLAQAGWSRKALPDDLVLYTHSIDRQLTPEARQKLADTHLMAEPTWFDTHPPLFKRVGALMKAKLAGVMKIDGPATVLFKDFGELSKMATIDFYQGVLGPVLQPEHLVPTQPITLKPSAPKPTKTPR